MARWVSCARFISFGLLSGLLWSCQTRDQHGPRASSAPASSEERATPSQPKTAAAAPSSQSEILEPEAPTPEASAAPRKASPRRPYRVAAIGDSITDSRMGGGYLKLLEAACPQSLFDNYGKGADMTNQMRRRFQEDLVPKVAERGYDTLIFYGGVNDLYSDETAGRSNAKIEADMSAVFREAKRLGLRVVDLTVSPWGGFIRYFNTRRGENTRLLNAWLLGEAQKPEKTRIIDITVDTYPLLSCGRPEVLCPEYETRSHDGIHPGARGHEIIGQAVLEAAFSDCL